MLAVYLMYSEDFKSREDVYNYLQSCSSAVLSTVSPDGMPCGAVIYFYVDRELNFFFFSKAGTSKVHNLEKNSKASLTLLDPEQPKTIQAKGHAAVVNDHEVYSQVFDNINKAAAEGKKGLYLPLPLSKVPSMTELLLIKFTPDWLRYGDFSDSPFFIETSKKVFDQIIPPYENT